MEKINKNVLFLGILALCAIGVAVFATVAQKNVSTEPFPIHKDQQKDQKETGKFFELKDYGVRIPVLEGMEDMNLFHNVSKENGMQYDSYGFTSNDVKDAVAALKNPAEAKACNDGRNLEYGSIGRRTDYPDGDDRPLAPNTRVLNQYYISYEHPQDVCTSDKSVQDLIVQKIRLVQRSFESMETLDGKRLPVVQQGTISGLDGYGTKDRPLNYYVCAELIDKSKSYCAAVRGSSEPDLSSMKYELTVPAGNYHVYGVDSENPRDPKADKVYYSTNPASDPSVVKIVNGTLLTDINLNRLQ